MVCTSYIPYSGVRNRRKLVRLWRTHTAQRWNKFYVNKSAVHAFRWIWHRIKWQSLWWSMSAHMQILTAVSACAERWPSYSFYCNTVRTRLICWAEFELLSINWINRWNRNSSVKCIISIPDSLSNPTFLVYWQRRRIIDVCQQLSNPSYWIPLIHW